MTAAGIDIGGTKIEVQIFDDHWQVAQRIRMATPQVYSHLITTIAEQIYWIEQQVGDTVPIGIGIAGIIDPNTGLALTANLPASGHPLQQDINKAVNRPISYVNDCRALALSEAVFGAGKNYSVVLSLILGTGVGGGISVDGQLWEGSHGIAGEFGHTPVSAYLAQKFALPMLPCGCGKVGCIETLIAGPGLAHLAALFTGRSLTPPEIANLKAVDKDVMHVWNVWCVLTADLLHNLLLTVHPDAIVLGGGLSQVANVANDLQRALEAIPFSVNYAADILTAQGGDASGARGAALAALQRRQHD